MNWQRLKSKGGHIIGFVDIENKVFAPFGYQPPKDSKQRKCADCGTTDNTSETFGVCEKCLAHAAVEKEKTT